jgi:hypothetical protein
MCVSISLSSGHVPLHSLADQSPSGGICVRHPTESTLEESVALALTAASCRTAWRGRGAPSDRYKYLFYCFIVFFFPPAGPYGEGERKLRIGRNICFCFCFKKIPPAGLYGEGEEEPRIDTKNLSSAHVLLQILY